MFLEIEVREEQKSFHQKYKRQKKKKKVGNLDKTNFRKLAEAETRLQWIGE